ncbi:TIGR01777 family protein [Bacillus sp. BGMRC 2118]|nr:TIGR01777 family protein [Bacillus sp. BGMRC 2118]
MRGKVVLAGGTGFIGQYFEQKFMKQGYEVKIISRQHQHISWNDQKAIQEALEGSEMLINLAGRTVNCRYNEQNKREIMNSRIETTTILGNAVEACQSPPRLWVNSSTATIYRHAEDRPMTEEKGEIGEGFSVDVAKAWEEAFFSYNLLKTRQVALRIAIVLGPSGGVMTPYMNLVKYGLGGKQGSGKQMFSWIHIEDLFNIVRFIQEHDHLSGVFNCSAPEPVSNQELMKTLREKMQKPFGLPAMKWMLELGAAFLRTETELVLKSRWVLPDRLQREGYHFTYHTLNQALDNIFAN